MPGAVGLEQKLAALKLSSPGSAAALDKAVATLADVLSAVVLLPNLDSKTEARLWQVFADVYAQEVATQQKASGKKLGLMAKRQVLADILVWAEVTQAGYDKHAYNFVTQPHQNDESFQRIGKLFSKALAASAQQDEQQQQQQQQQQPQPAGGSIPAAAAAGAGAVGSQA